MHVQIKQHCNSQKLIFVCQNDILNAMTVFVFNTKTTGLTSFESSPSHVKQPDLVWLDYAFVNQQSGQCLSRDHFSYSSMIMGEKQFYI